MKPADQCSLFYRLTYTGFFFLFLLFISLLTGCASFLANHKSTPQQATFLQLLNEAGLKLKSPDYALQTLPEPNHLAQLACDHQIEIQSSQMYLCIMIRPLSRMQIDYEDPHNSAPDPNQIYPLLFASILNKLSAHTGSATQEYAKAQSEALFSADWASAAAFTLAPRITPHYPHAFLIGIHKHHVADAYSLFVYNEESPENKDRLKRFQNLLMFAPTNANANTASN